MNMKLLTVSLLYAFLFALLIISPAYAQMGRGEGVGSGMGPMMHGYGFEQYDSRFEDFGSKTFKEVSDTFGVPVEDAISDLGLPEDMGTQLTVLENEEHYGIFRPGNCQLHGHEHAQDALLPPPSFQVKGF